MKWKDLLLNVNAVGEKVGLKNILLSKLSTIQKANFDAYIIKTRNDKFVWCSKCETSKRLRDVHTIGTKSYIAF
jgi:hypothetical protein